MSVFRSFLSSAKRGVKNIFNSNVSVTNESASQEGMINADNEYAQRIANELKTFDNYTNVHDLPEIFHYWSNKHLAPKKFHQFGITGPEQFFFHYTKKLHEKFPNKELSIVSIGCGNCDLEARLAKNLLDSDIKNFFIECIDINKTMLERGKEHAKNEGVEDYIEPVYGDFNFWKPAKKYDVILANQCLHHVMELENLFEAIKNNLAVNGYFLTSDMIGRNGHQRWPEALSIVQEFWKELPEAYRFNQMLKRHEEEYINHDCSTEGFEGIRAQDILPLLIKHFKFELFLPFANIVTAFIDRPFGHNFNAEGDWDRDFIDRLHQRDEEAMLSGEIKPTQILAVLCNEEIDTQLLDPILTPEYCVRQI